MTKRVWILLLSFLLLLLESGAPPARASDASIDWLRQEDDYAVAHYGRGFEGDADYVLAHLRNSRTIVEQALDTTFSGKFHVYLYPDYKAWTHGEELIYAQDDGIHLLTPSLLKTQVHKEGLPRILTHELTHLVAGQMRNGRSDTAPEWFWEGLADYVANWSQDDPEMARLIADYDADLRLAASTGELNAFGVGHVYYRGAQAVRFLFATFGNERMQQLIRTDTGSFTEDMKLVLGATSGDLRDAWFRWVSAEWQIPMSTITNDPMAGGVAQPDYFTHEVLTYRLHSVPVPTPAKAQVSFRIGEKTLYIGDRSMTADLAPFLADNTTMVPLRAIAEALGASVGWDEATRTITVGPTAARSETAPLDVSARGQYIRVAESFVSENGTLVLMTGATQPLPVEELEIAVDAPKAAFASMSFYYTTDEILRARPFAAQYTSFMDVAIRMEPVGDGTWRSTHPIILRPHPALEWKVIDRIGTVLRPEWTLEDPS